MKLLLDTCTFLWVISDSENLSTHSRKLFADPENEVYLSPVSVWEIMVKHGLGRLPMPEPPQQFVPRYRKLHGIQTLPLDEDAVLQLPRLPSHHKDPFDRMLICQAIAHGITLLTPDAAIDQYPVKTIW